MMQMHSDSSMSWQDRMAKMQSIREESSAKIEAVLTGDQKTKFEADKARMQQRMAERQNGGAMSGGDAPAGPPQ
jgi:Spy/CpxP family protein refolding chaperone